MKYYKRLWKNKCYKIFIGMFVFALVGFLAVYFSFYSPDGDYSYVFLMNHVFLVPHGYGLLLVAAFCFYTGFWFLPGVAREAQDLSEFQVEEDGEWLYIRYGKYEWKVKGKDFGPEQLCFKDAKGHFAGIITAYRVYNAICDRQEVRGQPPEYASYELLGQMDDKVCLSPEEKEHYIKKFELHKSHPFQKIFALFLATAALSSLRMPLEVMDSASFRRIGAALFGLFLFFLFGAGCVAVFRMSCAGKREYKYLKTHDVYRVRVYYYHKDSDADGDYLQFSDGKGHFFGERFHVMKNQWQNVENIVWYAYFYRQEDGNFRVRVTDGIL